VLLPPGLVDRDTEMLRRIQLIHQMPDVALNPRQRIGEIIGRPLELYLRLSGTRTKARLKELLEAVGLTDDFSSRYPGELSGGQMQRVCIARALAAEPNLIICDEVTSALDSLVAEEILKLLGRLQREHGYAYIFITHDLGTVRRVADRVAVMQRGRLIAEGPLGTIFAPPYHPYTELLLTSVPEMDTRWLDTVLAKRATLRTSANAK
jgi:peptide/nickel transport system ATP-binding protein